MHIKTGIYAVSYCSYSDMPQEKVEYLIFFLLKKLVYFFWIQALPNSPPKCRAKPDSFPEYNRNRLAPSSWSFLPSHLQPREPGLCCACFSRHYSLLYSSKMTQSLPVACPSFSISQFQTSQHSTAKLVPKPVYHKVRVYRGNNSPTPWGHRFLSLLW